MGSATTGKLVLDCIRKIAERKHKPVSSSPPWFLPDFPQRPEGIRLKEPLPKTAFGCGVDESNRKGTEILGDILKPR